MIHPDRKQRIQLRWKVAMWIIFVSAFLLMGYASSGRATRKRNIAVVAAMVLVMVGGLCKWKYNKNEVEFYNN